MRVELEALLDDNGRVASRGDLLAVLSRSALDDEIRRGHLVAVFPRAYARPWDADLPAVRERAALASVGGEVALSHLTGLGAWKLPVPSAPVHVTAYQPRHPRGVRGELVVHRTLLPLRARECNGLPVVRPVLAVVNSWPLLTRHAQRAPVIEAVRRRLCPEIMAVAQSSYWIAGIRQLRELVGQLLAGCESELELWGYLSVFDVDGLRHATRQKVVHVSACTYRLDMAYELERVVVELDGRAYHASTAQWERDIARDLALATVGWQTVRLSHSRLTNDVPGCRRDVLAVLAARRPRLGLAPGQGDTPSQCLQRGQEGLRRVAR